MCIGIPVEIERSDGFVGFGVHAGAPVRIDLALVGAQPPGSWVLLHAGMALRTLQRDEARLILDALDGARRAIAGERFEHLFADLIEREPQLPPHLRATAESSEDPGRDRDGRQAY